MKVLYILLIAVLVGSHSKGQILPYKDSNDPSKVYSLEEIKNFFISGTPKAVAVWADLSAYIKTQLFEHDGTKLTLSGDTKKDVNFIFKYVEEDEVILPSGFTNSTWSDGKVKYFSAKEGWTGMVGIFSYRGLHLKLFKLRCANLIRVAPVKDKKETADPKIEEGEEPKPLVAKHDTVFVETTKVILQQEEHSVSLPQYQSCGCEPPRKRGILGFLSLNFSSNGGSYYPPVVVDNGYGTMSNGVSDGGYGTMSSGVNTSYGYGTMSNPVINYTNGSGTMSGAQYVNYNSGSATMSPGYNNIVINGNGNGGNGRAN
jgi:hypothetical protein